jgi:hypothetical protein
VEPWHPSQDQRPPQAQLRHFQRVLKRRAGKRSRNLPQSSPRMTNLSLVHQHQQQPPHHLQPPPVASALPPQKQTLPHPPQQYNSSIIKRHPAALSLSRVSPPIITTETQRPSSMRKAARTFPSSSTAMFGYQIPLLAACLFV